MRPPGSAATSRSRRPNGGTSFSLALWEASVWLERQILGNLDEEIISLSPVFTKFFEMGHLSTTSTMLRYSTKQDWWVVSLLYKIQAQIRATSAHHLPLAVLAIRSVGHLLSTGQAASNGVALQVLDDTSSPTRLATGWDGEDK